MNVVFIDRDGVINKQPPKGDWVKNWDEFHFIPRVKDAIALLNRMNFLVIVVTNQSGINRGIFTHKDIQHIHNRLQVELKRFGAHIDAFYYCPHRPEENCNCRKPKTGLLMKAAKDYGFNFKNSYLIGNEEKDIEAGKNVGCKTILIGRDASNLYEAVKIIIGR